jgi:hypothetical protein
MWYYALYSAIFLATADLICIHYYPAISASSWHRSCFTVPLSLVWHWSLSTMLIPLILPIVDSTLSILAFIANIMIMFVLVKMKSAKKATNILFCNLTLSHFVLVIAHSVRTISESVDVTRHSVCVALMVPIVTSCLTYITTLAILYMELYLSAKLLWVGKSVFSPRNTIIILVLVWIFWILVALAGIGLLNPLTKYKPLPFQLCALNIYIYQSSYVGLCLSAFAVSVLTLFVCYLLTYCLIRKAFQTPVLINGNQGQPNPDELRQLAAQVKSAEKQQEHLNLLLCIMIVVDVCWGLFILLPFLAAFCPRCRFYFDTTTVLVCARILFAIPMISNAVIYVVKNPAFKMTFRRTWCRCMEPPRVHPVW